jgi:predicted  nucleic acid-binding Zn-ribbon protein
MKAGEILRYLDDQMQAIEVLVGELEEIQVAFNAKFDEWQSQHDAALQRLTDQIAERPDAIGSALRSAIDRRVPLELKRIEERRQKVQEDYLPRRQRAADALLQEAQAELAEMRTLNPQLDEQEEELKNEKSRLEAHLLELNERIRASSKGLGVIRNLRTITKDDRERQRIIGRLQVINRSLYKIRHEWEQKSGETRASQTKLQAEWQMESIAVARLQSELDQLDNQQRRQDLAQRRATRQVLDALKEPVSSSDLDLEPGLQEMVNLNIRTDAYHEGLASVGGLIGLLRGINNGMDAVRKSVDGLAREQEMHSAYLKPLDFSLPARVRTFHKQWSSLTQQFTDEETIGAGPEQFSTAVKPLLEGPLSEVRIEDMFSALEAMIRQATKAW